MRPLSRQAAQPYCPAPSPKVTFPTRLVSICPELLLFRQADKNLDLSKPFMGVVVLHKWRQRYTLFHNLFFSSSIRASSLFIRGTDGWGLILGHLFTLFSMWGFYQKSWACGTAHAGNTSQRKCLGPAFLVCRTRRSKRSTATTSDRHCVS